MIKLATRRRRAAAPALVPMGGQRGSRRCASTAASRRSTSAELLRPRKRPPSTISASGLAARPAVLTALARGRAVHRAAPTAGSSITADADGELHDPRRRHAASDSATVGRRDVTEDHSSTIRCAARCARCWRASSLGTRPARAQRCGPESLFEVTDDEIAALLREALADEQRRRRARARSRLALALADSRQRGPRGAARGHRDARRQHALRGPQPSSTAIGRRRGAATTPTSRAGAHRRARTASSAAQCSTAWCETCSSA